MDRQIKRRKSERKSQNRLTKTRRNSLRYIYYILSIVWSCDSHVICYRLPEEVRRMWMLWYARWMNSWVRHLLGGRRQLPLTPAPSLLLRNLFSLSIKGDNYVMIIQCINRNLYLLVCFWQCSINFVTKLVSTCMCSFLYIKSYHFSPQFFRFLNADNEMRRIFGARVVRAEGGQGWVSERASERVIGRLL